MDPALREKLRQRVREIIAEKHDIKLKHHKGGFLHLLPLVASALPSVVEAGKKLFSGSGRHKEDAKTRKPNAHAQLVKKVMADAKASGKPLCLPEASRIAKQMADNPKFIHTGRKKITRPKKKE